MTHPGADPAWTAIDATLDDLLAEVAPVDPASLDRESQRARHLHGPGVLLSVCGVLLEPRSSGIYDVLLWSGRQGNTSVSVCHVGAQRVYPWTASISYYDGAVLTSRYVGEGRTLTEAEDRALMARDLGDSR